MFCCCDKTSYNRTAVVNGKWAFKSHKLMKKQILQKNQKIFYVLYIYNSQYNTKKTNFFYSLVPVLFS